MTEPAATSAIATTSMLLLLPNELQVHILTYLRAYDLSSLHQTCKHYANPQLVHSVVLTTAEHVYPADLTQGFAATCPLTSTSLYTLGHLRHMEWLVVARVLSRPEPRSGGGFYISKSWCRTALQWLEAQQERQQQLEQQQQAATSVKKPKKLSRKQQKMLRSSKNPTVAFATATAAVAGPPEPWPDVNSDLLCCHDQLQRCSNSKSARARRRLVDKQAWKAIQKLYPNSTPLSAVQGECVSCRLELETKKQAEEERVLQMKMQRKQPLNNPVLRRFYTRTRGVPTHCLVQFNNNQDQHGDTEDNSLNDLSERGMIGQSTGVPLIPGRYYVLPRAWCQKWRRYIKTGDAVGRGNGGNSFSPSSQPPSAPDASAMFCDAHRGPVLPPHLEAYLCGQTSQLFASTRAPSIGDGDTNNGSTTAISNTVASPRPESRSSVVGMAHSDLDPNTLHLLQAAGLSQAELMAQRNAMLEWERQRRRQQEQQERLLAASAIASSPSTPSKQEYLDRENYIVVEILSEDEYLALEALWPDCRDYIKDKNDGDRSSNRSHDSLQRGSRDCLPCDVWFDVHQPALATAAAVTMKETQNLISFCTWPCQECEASGICNVSSLSSLSKKLLKH